MLHRSYHFHLYLIIAAYGNFVLVKQGLKMASVLARIDLGSLSNVPNSLQNFFSIKRISGFISSIELGGTLFRFFTFANNQCHPFAIYKINAALLSLNANFCRVQTLILELGGYRTIVSRSSRIFFLLSTQSIFVLS